jgi:hypothetical protein
VWQRVCYGEVVERENSFVEASDTSFTSFALPLTVPDCHHVACTNCVVERNALGDFMPFGDLWHISAVEGTQN